MHSVSARGTEEQIQKMNEKVREGEEDTDSGMNRCHVNLLSETLCASSQEMMMDLEEKYQRPVLTCLEATCKGTMVPLGHVCIIY